MKLYLLTVGKMKKDYFRQGVEDYLQRLQHFTPIEWFEIPAETIPPKCSEKNSLQIKEREGEKILSRIPQQAFLITLTPEGKTLTSPKLAQKMEALQNEGRKAIAFVIGGALGLGNNLLQKSNLRLSLSGFTLAHELAALVLCEQVYRSFNILKGTPYHK